MKPRRDFRKPFHKKSASGTSWEAVSDWYGGHLKKTGTFQEDIVFPGALRLLAPKSSGRYLDIACGEGSFARLLAKGRNVEIFGVDAAPSLIAQAKRQVPSGKFETMDAAEIGTALPASSIDGAVCILAIQNIEKFEDVIAGAGKLLKSGAPFVIVMNHPSFRQPRQSGWGWDEQRKLQYRRVDKYLSSYNAPIQAHPGADAKVVTWSYHRPLSAYAAALAKSGFVIGDIEEWVSHRVSDSGPKARAENAARVEIPMFMAIKAIKK